MLKTTVLCTLISSAVATLFPFLTVYLQFLGLTTIQCGLIRAFQSLAAIPSGQFWKSSSEVIPRKRMTIAFSAFVCAAFYLSLTFIPSTRNSHFTKHHGFGEVDLRHNVLNNSTGIEPAIIDGEDINIILNMGESSSDIYEKAAKSDDGQNMIKLIKNITDYAKSDNNFRRNVLNKVRKVERPPVKKGLYIVILLLLTVAAFMINPVRSLRAEMNSKLVPFDLLKRKVHEKVAASICVIIAACLIILSPCQLFMGVNHFVIHFYMFAFLMFLVILNVCFHPLMENNCNITQYTTDGREYNSPVIFIAVNVLGGYWNAVFFDYRLWIAEDYDARELLFATIVVTGFQSRILASFLCCFISKKRYSLLVSLILSYFFYATGLLFTSFISFSWAFVPVQCAYGFAYELMGLAINSCSSPRTDHVFLKESILPFGFALGTFVSSVLISYRDTRTMFRYNSYFCIATFVILCGHSLYLLGQNKNSSATYSTLKTSSENLEADKSENVPQQTLELVCYMKPEETEIKMIEMSKN